MKPFKAKDSVGRIWQVEYSAVKEDYIKAVMDMDRISRKDAKKYVSDIIQDDPKELTSWWYEQILPYGDLVKHCGVLVQDITQEEKEDIIDRITNGWMENV